MFDAFFKYFFNVYPISPPKLDSNGGFVIALDNDIDVYISPHKGKAQYIHLACEVSAIDKENVERKWLMDILCAQYANQQPIACYFGINEQQDSLLLLQHIDLSLGQYELVLEQIIIFAKMSKYWQQKLLQNESDMSAIDKPSLNTFNLMNLA
ncbi:hypothetical protein [uncultured Shewanella sp.]|uniref:hypothetical protein n=1 Tax=uncultured Shewanella sp. TaxID=173975 RepID=UPI00261B8A66|nr:hypothetical protein [uncultured Shewanella sp.]